MLSVRLVRGRPDTSLVEAALKVSCAAPQALTRWCRYSLEAARSDDLSLALARSTPPQGTDVSGPLKRSQRTQSVSQLPA
jgi:hypothetical protein